MKKAIICFALALLAGNAHAISVPFAWNGGSLNATGALALASYSPTPGSAGFLNDGETASGLEFGRVSLIGGGDGNLSIGVNFVSPETATATVSGAYTVFSVFFFSGGTWTGGFTDFDYNYLGNAGTARLTMNPIEIQAQLGPTFKFIGSITNLGSRPAVQALSEAGSLGLLGLGLVAIGMIRRKPVTSS